MSCNISQLLHDATGISSDSRCICPGDVFFALPCDQEVNHIQEAQRKGAQFVVREQGLNNGLEGSIFYVENVRQTLALACSQFYKPIPQTLLGVTGTNGKSSTVYFVHNILNWLGVTNASMGTLGVYVSKLMNLETPVPDMTTYDAVALHKILQELAKKGIDTVALEATSHGLAQHRLDGLKFDGVALTNVTQDHLDYHGTLQNYVSAKVRLFQDLAKPGGFGVLNLNSAYLQLFQQACNKRHLKTLTYQVLFDKSDKSTADFCLFHIRQITKGYCFDLRVQGETFHDIPFPILGDFQLENLLCAVVLVRQILPKRFSFDDILNAIPNLSPVPGRLDLIIPSKTQCKIFVDFCHTPDALQRTLRTLRAVKPRKLIVVFGCGGERDHGKRPLMGTIADQNADFAIITDDNPRNEDPSQIRRDILQGFKNNDHVLEVPKRQVALQQAVEMLKEGDILLIAGRGHEKFQKIQERRIPFNDKEFVEHLLKIRTVR